MASATVAAPAANGRPKKPASAGRPNYNLIHKDPLPVRVEGLPPLIPHNPLSILTIGWLWIKSIWWRSDPTPTYVGVFDTTTRSVNVIDQKAVRALWEAGFFGKGTLSRSEPTWLDREKRKRGLIASETSEEITRKRRLERQEFKKDRARKEQELIESTLKHERGEAADSDGTKQTSEAEREPGSVEDAVDAAEKGLSRLGMAEGQDEADDTVLSEELPIENLEHLQLSLEEAFFLSFGLGVLEIQYPSQTRAGVLERIPNEELFPLFRAFSTFPPTLPVPSTISPSDPFVANYAVYHHFRSLGWCVRPGPKFAADWMLYNRGPALSHAEFAVITMPSYSHAKWKTPEGLETLRKAGVEDRTKSWHWLHMVNRVQSQVRKTLVLAYVEMPPPVEADQPGFEPPSSILKRMKIREVVLKRWTPNRNRD